MKKVIYIFLLMCFFMIVSNDIYAKDGFKEIDGCVYTYKSIDSKQVQVTKIELINDKKTLIIPSRIDGKKVVKLGSEYDSLSCDKVEYICDVFGINDWGSGKVLDDANLAVKNKVNKLKTIILPKYLKATTVFCFAYLDDEKEIVIPSKYNSNLFSLFNKKWTDIFWGNRFNKCIQKNDLLISKNGKRVFGLTAYCKNVILNKKIEKIEDLSNLLLKSTKSLYISDKVKEIKCSKKVLKYLPKIIVSKKNKYLKMKKNCLIKKKTNEILLLVNKRKTFKVPSGIKCTKKTIYVGKKPKLK